MLIQLADRVSLKRKKKKEKKASSVVGSSKSENTASKTGLIKTKTLTCFVQKYIYVKGK